MWLGEALKKFEIKDLPEQEQIAEMEAWRLQQQELEKINAENSRLRWIEDFYRKSYMPVDVRDKTFENFECDAENKAAFDLVNAWQPTDNFGFLLVGPSGSGKSHLMQAIINRIVAEDRSFSERQSTLMWFSVSIGLDVIRSEMSDGGRYKDKALTSEYLFLDDIGVENPTDWAREQLFQILEHRLCMKAPTFISTNLTLDEIKSRMHERVTSRIKEMCVIVQLKGRDRRTDKMKENIQTLKARLK